MSNYVPFPVWPTPDGSDGQVIRVPLVISPDNVDVAFGGTIDPRVEVVLPSLTDFNLGAQIMLWGNDPDDPTWGLYTCLGGPTFRYATTQPFNAMNYARPIFTGADFTDDPGAAGASAWVIGTNDGSSYYPVPIGGLALLRLLNP